MQKSLFAGAIITAAALAAPAMAQDSPQALQEAFVAAVIAEDPAALAALYTEDAASYSPDGSMVEGRAAIEESWGPFFDAFDGFSVEMDQRGEVDMGKKGHAAWGLAIMSATLVAGEEPASEPTTWNIRFTDVSVKTKDGWRYVVDHASMMKTPESEAAGEEANDEMIGDQE